jgi:putative DNA primase/helicase
MNKPERAGEIAKRLMQEPAREPKPAEEIEWLDPQPLPDALPPVQPFDFNLLPSSMRPLIEDIAERVQCPPDYPAIAIMIVVATVVGRKVGIRPKRQDDWTVVPNLWGAAIGPPGVMKTPAIQEPLKLLRRLEIQAKKDFDAKVKEYEAKALVAKQRRRATESQIREALKAEDGDDPMDLARRALSAEEPSPTRKRYLVNDTTVEKLGEILNQNCNGVLRFREELIALLKSLDKEGQEEARGFYLEAWNGDGRHTYDRIGRGTIDIEAAIVSILGSIQPGPLRNYLYAAITGGGGADGLIQRFQLAVYPDISKDWRNVDRWPDTPAKTRAFEIVCRLDNLRAAEVGAGREALDEPDDIPCLRFESAAQDRFDEWRGELEPRLRSDHEHPVIIEHLSKYRSLIPSLALLIHLAEGWTGPVRLAALERAIAWGVYLESHAHRIYAVAIAPDTVETIALGKKLLAGELEDEFAVRDVYRKGWISLNTKEAAERAVEGLCDLDWLVEVEQPTATKRRRRFLANPKLPGRPLRGTDKSDKSPGVEGERPDLSVLSVPPEGESSCAAPESQDDSAGSRPDGVEDHG